MHSKSEYPPLLKQGFHPMSVEELRQLCVDQFTASTRRAPIMDKLTAIIQMLKTANVPGKLWVDGSFLTQKIEPEDVDIVLETSFEAYESANTEHKQAVDLLLSNLKASHLCDSYVCFSLPEGHEEYGTYEWLRSYWIKQFGFSRNEDFKGMALIDLSGDAQ